MIRIRTWIFITFKDVRDINIWNTYFQHFICIVNIIKSPILAILCKNMVKYIRKFNANLTISKHWNEPKKHFQTKFCLLIIFFVPHYMKRLVSLVFIGKNWIFIGYMAQKSKKNPLEAEKKIYIKNVQL